MVNHFADHEKSSDDRNQSNAILLCNNYDLFSRAGYAS